MVSKMKNEMKLEFSARSVNEGLARIAVAAFMTDLNPTLEEVEDVKTAVSEAVTNCIIHGYGMDCVNGFKELAPEEKNMVYIICSIENHTLFVEIKDDGIGIENIPKAMEPLYTTKPELERSGMGFAFMEAFMDELLVTSQPGKGTSVKMKKIIQSSYTKSEPV